MVTKGQNFRVFSGSCCHIASTWLFVWMSHIQRWKVLLSVSNLLEVAWGTPRCNDWPHSRVQRNLGGKKLDTICLQDITVAFCKLLNIEYRQHCFYYSQQCVQQVLLIFPWRALEYSAFTRSDFAQEPVECTAWVRAFGFDESSLQPELSEGQSVL